MATKKTVDTVKEDLRVLHNEVEADVNNNSWLSSEFWTMAVGAVANIVAVGVLLGWVDRVQADAMVQALTAVIGATQVIVVNSALIWKYIASKTELRAQMLDMRYRYMESVAIERIRMEVGCRRPDGR
jgi:cellulase/cellobiase CelA1